MKKLIVISFLIFSIYSQINAQDTIIVKPANYYSSSDRNSYYGLGFEGKYGREDIIFSKTHKCIEYIYYVDNKRIVGYKNNYWLLNDSTLLIGDTIKKYRDYSIEWTFKPLPNGKYFCYRNTSDIYEFGEADSILPFKYSDLFYTLNKNRTDTLWTTKQVDKLICSNCYVEQKKFYKSKIYDKIYEYYEIDTPPTFLNGDSIKSFNQETWGLCYNEPMVDFKIMMSFIITKDGMIKNIEEAPGDDICPNNKIEIIKELYNWGKLKPATKKGKNVNVRWFITSKEKRNHPGCEDTKKNREKYIKIKQKLKE